MSRIANSIQSRVTRLHAYVLMLVIALVVTLMVSAPAFAQGAGGNALADAAENSVTSAQGWIVPILALTLGFSIVVGLVFALTKKR